MGKLSGLKIAICGDITHSRVARSNLLLLNAMGAQVNLVGPRTLIPADAERLGANIFHSMREGLEGCDIVMMLRIQNERMQGAYPVGQRILSPLRAEPRKVGLCQAERAGDASRPDEPGAEIDSELADDTEISLIRDQVEMGVAVRMAALEALAANLPNMMQSGGTG